MNTLEIPSLGKRIEYPSTWEECSVEQLKYIFAQAHRLMAGEMELLEFQIRIFYHLTGIERNYKHERKERLMSEDARFTKYDNIFRAARSIDFIFIEKEGQLVFEFDCIENLLPSIEVDAKVFYGPIQALFNITFAEYRVAYDFYCRYIDEADDIHLNNLCAVLYRPAGTEEYTDDIREPFNPHLCVRRSDLFKKVPLEIRSIILAWFSACDNYFKTGQLSIDGREISFAPLFKSSGNQSDDTPHEDSGELGLTGVLLTIADSGTFGPVVEVEKTNLYTVLLKLYQWHLEHKRNEKHRKNHGRT